MNVAILEPARLLIGQSFLVEKLDHYVGSLKKLTVCCRRADVQVKQWCSMRLTPYREFSVGAGDKLTLIEMVAKAADALIAFVPDNGDGEIERAVKLVRAKGGKVKVVNVAKVENEVRHTVRGGRDGGRRRRGVAGKGTDPG